jgi:hypothetical protein
MTRKATLVSALAGACMVSLLINCFEGPTGPAGPSLSCTLSGYVVLVNTNGSQPSNRDSVMVTLDGTGLSTLTDVTGKWVIPNVHTGTYTIIYNKSGSVYGITKSVQAQIVGGNDRDLGVIYLCQPPSITFDSLSEFQLKADSSNIWIKVYLSADSSAIPYRTLLVFSSDTNITSAPSIYQVTSFFNTIFKNGVDSTNIKLTPATFASAGFSVGATVYVAGFLANAGSDNSSYLDTATGRTQYTNFNTKRSNILTITVPSPK